jgi:hypothetical protein
MSAVGLANVKFAMLAAKDAVIPPLAEMMTGTVVSDEVPIGTTVKKYWRCACASATPPGAFEDTEAVTLGKGRTSPFAVAV